MVGNIIQLFIGMWICFIFGGLILSAIRDPKARKQLLKTSRIYKPTPLFNFGISVMLGIFYITFLYLTIDAIVNIVEAFSS